MELTFRGEFEYAVDDKGRMVVPPKFRAALTDTVVLGRGAEGQIWVYPKPDFEQRLLKAQEMQLSDPDADFDMGLRFWLAANDAEVDRQGRLAIPNPLRRQVGITNSAIIVGNGERVEIWNPAKWDRAVADWNDDHRTRKDDFQAMRRAGLRP